MAKEKKAEGDRLALTLVESFREARISKSKGHNLVKQKRWPVHYIDGKPIVLLPELIEHLKGLPTVCTHSRGGWRPKKPEANSAGAP